MIKIRNIIIYIVVCIIVVFSFTIPEILLKKVHNNIQIAVYNKEKKSNTIDVESEKIYLVKAIHGIEGGATIEISRPKNQYILVEEDVNSNTGIIGNIKHQLVKLKEYNILKNYNISENTKISMSLINKKYQNNTDSYIVNHITLIYNNTQYVLNIEDKTGKILYIEFDKNNLYDKNNKKEMLENYIKYLNLSSIEDWKYEIDEKNRTSTMTSEKADVRILITETSENYIFSFHIINKFKVIDTN